MQEPACEDLGLLVVDVDPFLVGQVGVEIDKGEQLAVHRQPVGPGPPIVLVQRLQARHRFPQEGHIEGPAAQQPVDAVIQVTNHQFGAGEAAGRVADVTELVAVVRVGQILQQRFMARKPSLGANVVVRIAVPDRGDEAGASILGDVEDADPVDVRQVENLVIHRRNSREQFLSFPQVRCSRP